MKVQIKLVIYMLLWLAVTMFVVDWLNELALGPQWVHIALNLGIWFGGWIVICVVVLKRAKPEQKHISAGQRLGAMAWIMTVVAVLMAVASVAYVRMSGPGPIFARGATELNVMFVALFVFAVSCLVLAGTAFWFLQSPSIDRRRLVLAGCAVLILGNALLVLAGAYFGLVASASTLVISTPMCRAFLALSREVLEEG